MSMKRGSARPQVEAGLLKPVHSHCLQHEVSNVETGLLKHVCHRSHLLLKPKKLKMPPWFPRGFIEQLVSAELIASLQQYLPRSISFLDVDSNFDIFGFEEQKIPRMAGRGHRVWQGHGHE